MPARCSYIDVEVLPGIVAVVEETCWHPLGVGGSAGPDRPCHPASRDSDPSDWGGLYEVGREGAVRRLNAGLRWLYGAE